VTAPDPFGQAPYPCRFFWGPEGAGLAGDRGDIVVVVDVFSFSTTVCVAVSRGGEVLPALSPQDAGDRVARHRGAVLLPGRRRPTAEGWSHSPASLQTLPPGTRVVYFSPNGGHCCARAEGAGRLFVGALVNAAAVAAAAAEAHRDLGRPVSVVACGERWVGEGSLRPSLEDELGAGAIIAALRLEASPEARAAAATFETLRARLPDLLWDCGSGRELRALGFSGDVRLMAGVDTLAAVPSQAPDGWIRGAA